jgi:stage V sporulation protein G
LSRHIASLPETFPMEQAADPRKGERERDYSLLGLERETENWYEGGVMEVTEVRIFSVQEDRLKAYVTITFDHCFVVRDLKVIHGNNGLFVAMPSKKRKDGTYRDTAHPLDNQTREMIESRVLEEYKKEVHKNRECDPQVPNSELER